MASKELFEFEDSDLDDISKGKEAFIVCSLMEKENQNNMITFSKELSEVQPMANAVKILQKECLGLLQKAILAFQQSLQSI